MLFSRAYLGLPTSPYTKVSSEKSERHAENAFVNVALILISRTACFPLYSVLLALGNPTVDYFSLDVEGAEWPIMESLPWDKVNISIISLENAHLGAENALLEAHMIKNGYEIKQKVDWDTIFVKKGLVLA